MYAIIRTGGKQYKVQPGDTIRVEKLEQDLGAKFDLTDVLMVGGDKPVFGAPTVKNALVSVVVTKQTKDKKVIIFKKKRRQGYRRFKTHRQPFTELYIQAISVDGKVTKSEGDAKVVDVDQARLDKLQAKAEAKEVARQEAKDSGVKPAAAKAASKKKVAKKAPAKKPAKKKAGAKKSGAKKAKKKTTKK